MLPLSYTTVLRLAPLAPPLTTLWYDSLHCHLILSLHVHLNEAVARGLQLLHLYLIGKVCFGDTVQEEHSHRQTRLEKVDNQDVTLALGSNE